MQMKGNMRVAVVGAGASGLCAIKACLDEGLDVVCFEKNNFIGGLWYFTEEDGHSSVMRSTVINTSRQMMSFTDFPIPSTFPLFMHNTKVLQYFELYAKHFDLHQYIKFDSIVQNVFRSEEFNRTGQWIVNWAPKGKEIVGQRSDVFDAVLVCTGHHWQKSWPTFEGMDIFEGKQIHSKSYKDARGYENKVVVVVGFGNSGGDIACELSRCTKQVYSSTRRGAWVMSRQLYQGYPFDQLGLRRGLDMLPMFMKNPIAKAVFNSRFNHESWGIKPDHSAGAQHPMVNDDLPVRIACGTLIVKPNIERLTKKGVIFSDGTFVDDVDVIIYATGYMISFPLLENGKLIDTSQNHFDLYKYMFLPELGKQTLACVGVLQPVGAINPLVDMQCRLATRVFQGKTKLPSKDAMRQEIEKVKEKQQKRYYMSSRHTVQVDVIPYGDELAELIGCKPNLMKMFFTDPLLALQCFFGPCYPQQYRLEGPGQWYGARDYIMNAHLFIYSPMSKPIEKPSTDVWAKFVFLIFVFFVFVYFWQ